MKFYGFGDLGSRAGCRGEAGGFALGCSQPPGSSSGHGAGSTEPDAVCELLWGLGARVGAAAKAVAWPESVPGQRFSGLVIPNTISPHAFC